MRQKVQRSSSPGAPRASSTKWRRPIRAAGGTCTPLQALAGVKVDAEKTVGRAIADWGRVDVLVNNAHTFTDFLPVEDPKMEENCMIDIQSCFLGSLQLMQLCHPHMVKQGGGSIINMSSSYGIRCEPGFLAYAASKEALRALTRTAAREWGKLGIRVNTVLPSALTPKSIWYGRFGTPEDNADVIVALASHQFRFVTGAVVNTDGGTVVGGGWFWNEHTKRFVNRPAGLNG